VKRRFRWRTHCAGIARLSGLYPGHTKRTESHAEEAMMSGKMDEAKGKVKQAAGDITGDPDMKREGQVDEGAGKVKEGVDKVKDKLTGD
jgi:uncharacterized protein YjbJ (UPF0337 family)